MNLVPKLIAPSCILVTTPGVVDVAGWIALFEALFRDHGKLKGFLLLGDLRGSESNLGFRSEFEIANYMRQHLSQLSGLKWAFLTDSELMYGLARMGQIITSDFPFECQVFQSAEEAATWLGQREVFLQALQQEGNIRPGN